MHDDRPHPQADPSWPGLIKEVLGSTMLLRRAVVLLIFASPAIALGIWLVAH